MGPKSPFNPQARHQRALQATFVILLTLSTVGAAFFRTQVIRNHDFVLRSEDNRIRVVPIPAPRGAIYDRNGTLIAETETSFDLFLDPSTPDSVRASLSLLQTGLELSDSAIARTLLQMERQPLSPAPVAANLRFEQVAWVEERRSELSGISLEPRPRRHYFEGEAVAHLVGYVAEISERELADSTWAGYRMGQSVGKAGIERQYERLLGGQAGERYVEVDARGRVLRTLAANREKPPTPGRDIQLSLDVELQRFVHHIFPENRNGAVVAMVPSTGEVLALYSSPTYDPNIFTGGVSGADWRALNENSRTAPAEPRHHRHLSARLHLEAGHRAGRPREGTDPPGNPDADPVHRRDELRGSIFPLLEEGGTRLPGSRRRHRPFLQRLLLPARDLAGAEPTIARRYAARILARHRHRPSR